MRDYASLFLGLLSDLGVPSDCVDAPLSHDMGIDYVRKRAMVGSFFKKLCPNGNSASADAAALIKFTSVNDSLPSDHFDFPTEHEIDSRFWDGFRDILRTALDQDAGPSPLDLEFIRNHMDLGPGASQKVDSRSFVTKLFSGAVSTTNSHLIRIYRGAIVETGAWALAERRRFNEHGFIMVEGGSIFFAPKNAEISRTCCTEAVLNMLIQQAIRAFLCQRLEKFFGISLSTQEFKNREMARQGSKDGSFGTTDLVSASDSVGFHLVQSCISNPTLLGYMNMSRSEVAVLPDGRKVKLNMMSTMGNGFTFPLQTIIFASVVKAAYTLMGIPSTVQAPGFGVYGDDIVVRREAFDFVNSMLTKLGFTVNVGKSFNTGFFRESCGGDYFKGLPVRGVYIRSLESSQSVYSAFNRLLRWSANYGIRLPTTLATLKAWARDIRVPPSDSVDAGFHVPLICTMPRLDDAYWFIYRRCQRRRKVMAIDDLKVPSSSLSREALAVGFMSGTFRRRDVSLTTLNDSAWNHDWSVDVPIRDRQGARPRYKVTKAKIPHWDYFPQDLWSQELNQWEFGMSQVISDLSYDSWKAAVVETQLFKLDL